MPRLRYGSWWGSKRLAIEVGAREEALPLQAPTTHNARHQQGPVLSVSRHECAHSSWTVVAKSARFLGAFTDGDGLKNRRLRRCKISIREVLISVTLSIRGEVAERLKAAVC
jgi:hypothetical protein